MIEPVSRAIQAELRRQGVLHEDGEDLGVLMMRSGAAADLPAVVRAALRAMREPSKAMVASVYDGDFDIYWNYRADGRPGGAEEVYTAMIDAAET